jgi:hypothetical protein
MTLYEYVPQALLTESALNPLSVETIERGVDPRILHSLIGISTEVAEVIDAIDFGGDLELFEELSDLLWYVAIIIDAISITTGDTHADIILPINGQLKDAKLMEDDDQDATESDRIRSLVNIMTVASGEGLDIYKKAMFYGKPLYKDESAKNDTITALFKIIFEIVFSVQEFIKILNDRDEQYTFYNCLEANIAKLKKRYPDKFTKRDAETRNVDDEYDAMRAVLNSN